MIFVLLFRVCRRLHVDLVPENANPLEIVIRFVRRPGVGACLRQDYISKQPSTRRFASPSAPKTPKTFNLPMAYNTHVHTTSYDI